MVLWSDIGNVKQSVIFSMLQISASSGENLSSGVPIRSDTNPVCIATGASFKPESADVRNRYTKSLKNQTEKALIRMRGYAS